LRLRSNPARLTANHLYYQKDEQFLSKAKTAAKPHGWQLQTPKSTKPNLKLTHKFHL